MGKIFNEDNEIIWICSIFGVLLLIGFTVIMRNVVIPEYKNEYEDKTKYLYEITIDEKKYIVDRLHTKVKVSKIGIAGLPFTDYHVGTGFIVCIMRLFKLSIFDTNSRN